MEKEITIDVKVKHADISIRRCEVIANRMLKKYMIEHNTIKAEKHGYNGMIRKNDGLYYQYLYKVTN